MNEQIITQQMIEDYSVILGNDLGPEYEDLEFTELELKDLQRKGCDHLGISCDSCPRCYMYGDGTCPISNWESTHPNYVPDELDEKLKEKHNEIFQRCRKNK